MSKGLPAKAASNQAPAASPPNSYGPGRVFILDPHTTVLDDQSTHRHVLLTNCQPQQYGVLSYCSSQPTLAKQGSPYHLVKANRTGAFRNNLTADTYVYPTVLARRRHGDLPDPTATWTSELPNIRVALVKALGCGTGCCLPGGASWRGRLVQMSAQYTPKWGTSPCVVLTTHAYSAQRKYQIVVPVVDGKNYKRGAHLIEVTDREWLKAINAECEVALISPRMVHSVWHDDSIQSATNYVMDPDTLTDLETRVWQFLS